jgi:hypothetical protein
LEELVPMDEAPVLEDGLKLVGAQFLEKEAQFRYNKAHFSVIEALFLMDKAYFLVD